MFYDAAIDREKWPLALENFRRELGYDLVALGSIERGPSDHKLLYAGDCDDGFWSDFESYYRYLHPLNDYIEKYKPNVFFDQLFASGEVIAKSEFYNWLDKKGLKYYLGAKLNRLSDDRHMVLSFRRSASRGPATEDEIDKLAIARKHIERALLFSGIARPAETRKRSIDELLDLSPIGMAAISADGRLTRTNATFESLIRNYADMEVRDGRPLFARRALQTEFDVKLNAVVQNRKGGAGLQSEQLFFHSETGNSLIGILLHPISRRSAFELSSDDAVMMVVQSSRNFSQSALEAFADNFGLTDAETSLLKALLQEAALDDYADENGVSIGTVRWHMQNVLKKTGTRNQTHLVRLMSAMSFFRI